MKRAGKGSTGDRENHGGPLEVSRKEKHSRKNQSVLSFICPFMVKLSLKEVKQSHRGQVVTQDPFKTES